MSWTVVGHLLEHQPQCWLSSTLMWKCLIYIQSLQWQSFQRRMIWHLMMTLNSCVSMHVIYEPCKWLLTSWSVANVVVFHPEWAEYYQQSHDYCPKVVSWIHFLSRHFVSYWTMHCLTTDSQWCCALTIWELLFDRVLGTESCLPHSNQHEIV